MLIDFGADLEAGLLSETPLMAAADYGHTEVADLLITSGADLDATSRSGWSPLHWAAMAGHVETAMLLIDRGCNRNHVDNDGRNATDHARQYRDPIFAEVFRERGIPDIYSLEEVEDDWRPSGTFDFFISYRHGRYEKFADELARELQNKGRPTFIDRWELDASDDEQISRGVLKSRLKRAVRQSNVLLFFETYLDPRRDDVSFSPSLSWQFFELLHSTNALLISLERGTCHKLIVNKGEPLDKEPAVLAFSDMDELSDRLIAYGGG